MLSWATSCKDADAYTILLHRRSLCTIVDEARLTQSTVYWRQSDAILPFSAQCFGLKTDQYFLDSTANPT